jgi:hypothetical protein
MPKVAAFWLFSSVSSRQAVVKVSTASVKGIKWPYGIPPSMHRDNVIFIFSDLVLIRILLVEGYWFDGRGSSTCAISWIGLAG